MQKLTSYINFMKRLKGDAKMEEDIVILKCKSCGEEFLYQTHKGRGSKTMARYCDKCKALKARESRNAYRKKLREKQKAKNEEVKELAKLYHEETIQNVTAEEEEVVVDKYTEFINKISKLLMTLDTARVELCDLHKQMSEYQSAYDKSDQTYLHKLENINTEDMADMKRFVVEWKMSRGARRNVKDLIILVGSIIDAIPFKNYANAIPILKGNAFKPKI